MKNILTKLSKVLAFAFIVILIGLSVGLGIAYYVKNRELNDIYSEYNKARDNLNKNNQENQTTIDNLQTSFKELNQKVEDLTKENETLKQRVNTDGMGTIKGKILPLLVGDSSFSQYQLICAENIKNTNLQHCVTVSGLEPTYKLALPEGTYVITGRVLTKDSKSTLSNYQSGYTEFVQCVDKNGLDKCDKSQLSQKNVQVNIKPGEVIENINPTDWNEVK